MKRSSTETKKTTLKPKKISHLRIFVHHLHLYPKSRNRKDQDKTSRTASGKVESNKTKQIKDMKRFEEEVSSFCFDSSSCEKKSSRLEDRAVVVDRITHKRKFQKDITIKSKFMSHFCPTMNVKWGMQFACYFGLFRSFQFLLYCLTFLRRIIFSFACLFAIWSPNLLSIV